MEKKVVDLFDTDVPGLLIPCDSGIIWTNQTGGVSCHHPEIEGIFVPIVPMCVDWRFMDVVREMFENVYYAPYDFEQIEEFLKRTKLECVLQPIDKKLIKGNEKTILEEAWIWLQIRNPLKDPSNLLNNFAGYPCIFTYGNSD